MLRGQLQADAPFQKQPLASSRIITGIPLRETIEISKSMEIGYSEILLLMLTRSYLKSQEFSSAVINVDALGK